MKLQKVISGGQTGADQTALLCAHDLGFETGGTVPKYWRTDEGPAPWLVTFGCVEHASWAYSPRTKQNVLDAEATVWFGRANSAGYCCTRNAAKQYHKPFICNPKDLRAIAQEYRILNCAGNRISTNPEIVALVRRTFMTLAQGGF